ncbi:ABC transporter substrate-binding protein [Arenibaculum sp.]|jgi:peptide/nickel transport system substrate-binding protein|uniref:ABC transporter substrate-binding protein n=1 Tax=Arenibaculum sp. TaxID=2865862 RepID=UPI002E15B011|nr:ABC transporter substrate-binding protein [Arenibaculum sp.]
MRKLGLLAVAMVAAGTATGFAGAAHAQQRDTLALGLGLEPPHLDPTAGAAAAIDEVTYRNVFEGLTRIDEKGSVQPGLAESWEVSPDGLTYTFRLRDGVTFHDGTTFDSADVKFAYDRARGPDSVNAQKGYFAAIDTIETPDPRTVVVRLSRPDGLFLFNMGSGDASIVAPESAAGNGQNPVGTGPFRFGRWVPGDRVVLTANPDYREPGLPHLREVTFRFIADPAAQLNAVRSGDLDAFPIFGATESVALLEGDPQFQVVAGTTEGETILAFNHSRPPFDDVRVRRAIAHAIDRQEVVDGAMFGYGTPIGSHFAPHREGYVDLTGTYPPDLDAAKALLREAGVPDGFKTTIKLPPPPYARRSGEIIAAQLARVGIEAELIPVEWAQWLEQVFRGGNDFDMTIVAHVEPLDLDIYNRPDYYFNYHGDRYAEVMAELERTVDPAARNELYGQAQRILAEDAASGFLFQLPKVGVRRAGIEGMWDNAPVPANDMTEVRWTE